MSNLVSSYNPDVLSCIANLSNDEVFTPPEVANAMLDMLPQELFSDPNTTFLDPATKSGVFLREIAKRLLVGLEPTLPDLQERLDHIMHKQLYGIAMTELTSLLARRSLYCSKYPNSVYSISSFDDVQGNIRFKNIKHRWKDGKCVYCGATQKEGTYDREALEVHAYEFLHITNPKEILNMKFDVIIGNPPYQLETGGGSGEAATQAQPIYNKFVEQAIKLNPRYLCMIIPARWYSGGIGLGDFRNMMLNDAHISKLVDYQNSKDCFQGVDIAGGVCYFLRDRDTVYNECSVESVVGNQRIEIKRKLNEYGDVFIRNNSAISILNKVTKNEKFISLIDTVFALDAFGFPTSARGQKESDSEHSITIYSSKGHGYVSPSEIKKNRDIVDKYKVFATRLVPCNGEVGIDPSKGYKSITTPRILKPNEIITFSYILLGVFDTEKEAKNYRNYICTKFARFMLRLTYSSMNISKNNFLFVPKLDFLREWLDEDLFEYFGLTDDEAAYIDALMRPVGNEGDNDG
ncbi:MAG: Eco57I restriction-modification methylase domain-containing protein [Saccharofermentans sp.]|nr:Eco57I restriction-modification methylase domain-containing protein [Saccharofermentans sp.]